MNSATKQSNTTPAEIATVAEITTQRASFRRLALQIIVITTRGAHDFVILKEQDKPGPKRLRMQRLKDTCRHNPEKALILDCIAHFFLKETHGWSP